MELERKLITKPHVRIFTAREHVFEFEDEGWVGTEETLAERITLHDSEQRAQLYLDDAEPNWRDNFRENINQFQYPRYETSIRELWVPEDDISSKGDELFYRGERIHRLIIT